uniref:Uncharacterized protein n=1 Tax=Oryza punctata TaxID=4537 RepID=A0A0E0JK11_ORYPU
MQGSLVEQAHAQHPFKLHLRMKEALFGKPVNSNPTQSVHVYPTILIALICAFLSITYNVKKTVRNSQSVSITKPLQSSAKSKLK